MNRQEILDKIEQIQNNYLGVSQANELADLVEVEKKAECIAFMKYYFGEVNEGIFEKCYEDFKQATKR